MNFLTLLGLKSKNADTRRETIESLVDAGDPAVLPHLYPLLRDENPEVRSAAAKGVAEFRDFESVPPLCEALGDKEPSVRIAVLNALLKINDKTITRFVVPLLQDTDPAVQKKASNLLEHFRWTPGGPEEEAIILVAGGRFSDAAALGVPAVAPLILAFEGSSDNVRHSAIEALSTISDPRVWKILRQGLRDEARNVRLASIAGLRRVRDVRVFDLLCSVLKDPDEGVRQAAAEMLGEFGSRSVDPLCEVLGDTSLNVRVAASESLGKIGDPRATVPLAPLLSDEAPEARLSAVRALGELGDAEAINLLIPFLQDEDPEVRHAVPGALARIDPAWNQAPHMREMLDALGISDSFTGGQSGTLRMTETSDIPALQMVGSKEPEPANEEEDISLKPLFRELENTDPTVRFKAARDLGKTGNPRACSALESALNDEVPPVRRAAAEALVALPWNPSDPSLIAVQAIILQDWQKVVSLGVSAIDPLMKALLEFDSLSQKNAAMALGQIGSSLATDALLQALDSVDIGVRKASVEALARIGDARAIDGLMRAKTDPLKPVRDAAEAGLKQLGIE